MCTKGAQIAELFTKAIATTKSFDQNLRKSPFLEHGLVISAKVLGKEPVMNNKSMNKHTLRVVGCENGRMTTEFKVGPEHLNQRGTLHGGFIAHLVDAVSTYALTTNENVDTRGVSVEISVSYMSAAREGDNIEVEAITRKLGKKIAFLEVLVKNKDKNQLLATGRHTKYIGI